MILMSQDGLHAIPFENVCFFCIERKGKEYVLWAMPNIDQQANSFGMTSLFRHKNVEVVKRVLRFLAKGRVIADDNIIDVGIPALYKHGMSEIPEEMLADDSITDIELYANEEYLKYLKEGLNSEIFDLKKQVIRYELTVEELRKKLDEKLKKGILNE